MLCATNGSITKDQSEWEIKFTERSKKIPSFQPGVRGEATDHFHFWMLNMRREAAVSTLSIAQLIITSVFPLLKEKQTEIVF